MRSTARIPWIDGARGYAVALVFCGHFVENLYYLKVPAGTPVLKFIYSFHWPLFFVLAGYLGLGGDLNFRDRFHERVAKRVVPALFFSLLTLPFWLLGSGPLEERLRFCLKSLACFMKGQFIFCETAWFLICLFSVELLYVLWNRHGAKKVPPLLAGVLFLALGTLVCQQMARVVQYTGITQNAWMIHEAIFAFGFYLAGVALRESQLLRQDLPKPVYVLLSVVGFTIVLATFNLNNGPFPVYPPVVMMSLSSHGSPVWFPITALAGAAGVIALSRLTAGFRPLTYVGRNYLPYLALSAFFYNFVDPHLITRFGYLIGSTAVALLFSAITAGAWMLVSVPLIGPLNRGLAIVVQKSLAVAKVPGAEDSRRGVVGGDRVHRGGPIRPALP